MLNVLTVDVEDWFTSSLVLLDAPLSAYGQRPSASVVHNTHRILALLREYRCTSTFFVLGTVAEHYPELVAEIHESGHEVATHGYSHRLAREMTPSEFGDDLCKAITLTRNAMGNPRLAIRGYRAPYFSLTRQHKWAFGALLEHGIAYDSSIFPIRRRLYGDPCAPTSPYIVHSANGRDLWEFPPSTARLFGQRLPIAGGGYLRLFPYRFTAWGLRRLNGNGERAVVYLHPYEIDPTDVETRGLPIGASIRLVQTMGRGSMAGKLRRLFGEFAFGSIRDVFAP